MMDMYQEIILDHYKYPRNKGKLADPDIEFRDYNPLCGDEIVIGLKLGEDKVIKEIKFEGRGCAISQAAASMLTESLMGKSLEAAKAVKNQEMTGMLMIPISHMRIKCALLALMAMKKGILIYEGNNYAEGNNHNKGNNGENNYDKGNNHDGENSYDQQNNYGDDENGQ